MLGIFYIEKPPVGGGGKNECVEHERLFVAIRLVKKGERIKWDLQ